MKFKKKSKLGPKTHPSADPESSILSQCKITGDVHNNVPESTIKKSNYILYVKVLEMY